MDGLDFEAANADEVTVAFKLSTEHYGALRQAAVILGISEDEAAKQAINYLGNMVKGAMEEGSAITFLRNRLYTSDFKGGRPYFAKAHSMSLWELFKLWRAARRALKD